MTDCVLKQKPLKEHFFSTHLNSDDYPATTIGQLEFRYHSHRPSFPAIRSHAYAMDGAVQRHKEMFYHLGRLWERLFRGCWIQGCGAGAGAQHGHRRAAAGSFSIPH